MKTTYKILAIIALISIMCLCLCGCDELDQMKSEQATWTDKDNYESITYNGDTYKMIPSSLTKDLDATPSLITDTSVYITNPDVPVLLSHTQGIAFKTNADKSIIYGTIDPTDGPISYYVDCIVDYSVEDINAWFTIYCRSDLYDEVIASLKEGLTYTDYGFSYYRYDEETEEYSEGFQKLTKEQKAVIDEIEKTCKQTKHDEIYMPAMHVTQLIKISDNDLFYTDHWEIFTNLENDSYYLVFNNYNTNKSFSIDVPQKYNKTFDKILHDTNTNSFM